MVDSDDEFERQKRNRDKFRHERSDYDQKDDRRGRDQNKSNWSKQRDRRENDRTQRDRRSPQRNDNSPQAKRIRRDWEDNYHHYEGTYAPRLHGPHPPMWSPSSAGDVTHLHNNNSTTTKAPEVDYPTQPPMMSFKHFLATQDDNITDDESIKRYNEYKIDFKKEQIKEFFVQHKDEEWFRSKYHPEEYSQRQNEMKASLKKRCNVFKKLMQLNIVSSVSLDMTCTNELIRLLDSAVIFLEDGSEKDLAILDSSNEATSTATVATSTAAVAASTISSGSSKDNDKSDKDNAQDNKDVEIVKPQERGDVDNSEGGKEHASEKKSGDDDDDEAERMKEDVEEQGEKDSVLKLEETAAAPSSDKPRALHKTQSIFLRNLAPAITKQEVEAMCKRYPGFMRVSIQDPQPERRFARRGWITFDRTVNVKDICWNLNNIRLRDCDMGAIVNRELRQRVRPVNGLTVHKAVARQDIKHAAKIIQNLDGRWGLWEDKKPDEAKGEESVGDVTAGEGGANSQFSTNHEGLNYGFITNNPVLKNITDFLVDEVDYEEEVLGAEVTKDKESTSEVIIERDDDLLKVLDRMLLYLRVVYSIDFYGAFEYPNEDEMPHRCGIIHARGLNTVSKITQTDVTEWMSSFETKIAPFLNPKFHLDESEAVKLGKKNSDDEVEKFIVSNMQELGKDKWLCPLSGKKFKGPEFVRKHILSKHLEKVEEVKKEVAYFNNYLNDPRRLQLPEHPSAKHIPNPIPPPMMPGFIAPHPFYRPPPVYPGVYPSPFALRSVDAYRAEFRREAASGAAAAGPQRSAKFRADPRSVISYTDLDAPPEVD